MAGKVNSQLQFMCGRCKHTFNSERAVTAHINASHTTELVGVYKRVSLIDNRDKEESYADREIEARRAIAAGEPTDDAWLLGE